MRRGLAGILILEASRGFVSSLLGPSASAVRQKKAVKFTHSMTWRAFAER